MAASFPYNHQQWSKSEFCFSVLVTQDVLKIWSIYYIKKKKKKKKKTISGIL